MKKLKVAFVVIILASLLVVPWTQAQNVTNVSLNVSNEQEAEVEDVFKDITAPNLVLSETKTGRILYERNADEKIYPASVTKLLTAILVVEKCNLNETLTVSENAVKSVPFGYVNANLKIGEQLKVKDVLYAMLIPSANDAANALAEHVGGSIDGFSAMMNEKATELGCTGSHFTNPSGLHQETHYTTARDLNIIAKEAASNNVIRTIIGTAKYTLPKTAKYPKGDRILRTTNYMKLKELTKYYYEYCIGAKTGYTGEAHNCVIAFAKKNGIEVTAVVMGERAKIKGQKFLDAREMFEYVFNHYESNQLATKHAKYETIKVSNGTKETRNLDVLYNSNIAIVQEKTETNQPQKTVEYNKIKAPIQKGDVLGKITYEYKGIKYSSELMAASNVEESPILNYIFYGGAIFLCLVIIYILIKSKRKHKNY